MTLKDKLEIGLKEDAAYRKDNLPEAQVRGPEIPTDATSPLSSVVGQSGSHSTMSCPIDHGCSLHTYS
jgi:hypothetical protein